MSAQLLYTKLFIPPTRPDVVPRPRLLEQLNVGLNCKLTLVAAPAGFGKTTLLSHWIDESDVPVAWLSLDEGDNDLNRFLSHFVAALQTIEDNVGTGVLATLQSPGMVNVEVSMTTLLNEISVFPEDFILVIDDYHVIESQPVDNLLAFTLDHLPPHMHMFIASRIDPSIPLSRLRAGGHMTEIRADDLRFTTDETTAFLNQAMDLDLSTQDVAVLEARTEGWIVGLQLAALSMQGFKRSRDIADFVLRFTGSDHYIQDYLTDEVLQQRPKGTKDFLLQTSILSRLTGDLCDSVTKQVNGQEILKILEGANLFIVPLDNERKWYRYHHLFADILRQRLQQEYPDDVSELHIRASDWYEKNGLEIEAFQHAVAANDVERAERLIEGEGVPLQYRGAVPQLLKWLETLSTTVLDARPSLWVTYASALNLAGQPTEAEQKLLAAEAALQCVDPDKKTDNIVGHIAATRAMMAVGQQYLETILSQSHIALEFLHPDNLPVRTIINWTLGYAYQLQGDRAAASQAYTEVLSISRASGDIVSALAATTGLGNIQESENQLYLAAESYRRGMKLFGDPPQPIAVGTYLGLAKILYEWNDLDAAKEYGQLSIQLARQLESIDTFVLCALFLAQLEFTQDNTAAATAYITKADQFMRQHNFLHRMPEVAATQVLAMLRQGDLAAAADLAETHELPMSLIKVHLAQGDTASALRQLEPLRKQAEAVGPENQLLKVRVLQAVAMHKHGKQDEALQLLGDALRLAQPGGFIRTFVDEGPPMAQLLNEYVSLGTMLDYAGELLAAFAAEMRDDATTLPQPLVEPLSPRELEVLRLVAQGLTNREISEKLFIALDTVKGHNRRIFGKLGVKRRTHAVRKAISLKIIPPQ